MRAVFSFPPRLRIAAILLISVVAAVGTVATRAQDAEPWPLFTMTWRETANGLGLNGARGTQLFRLEYTDRRNFRTTLLENPTVPDAVGSTSIVGGDRSVFANARQKMQTVTNFEPGEYTVPSEWLVPGRIAYVQARAGYTTTPLGAGLARLVYEETLPDGKVVREETTYRVADLIPTLRVTTVDDVEVSRYEVMDFALGTP